MKELPTGFRILCIDTPPEQVYLRPLNPDDTQIINNRSLSPTCFNCVNSSILLQHPKTTTMSNVIKADKTALITGAASGVGFAVAKLCREKGMHLALLDNDRDNLSKAKAALDEINPKLTTEAYAMDVADQSAWKDIAEKISSVFPEIDLVVMNAGKGFKPEVQEDRGRLNPWVESEYWARVRRSIAKTRRTYLT